MLSLSSILSSGMSIDSNRVYFSIRSKSPNNHVSLFRPMLPFMTNYQFLCKDCSPTKPEEQFLKKTASRFQSKEKKENGILFLAFNQLCTTALANLTQQSTSHTFFSRDRVGDFYFYLFNYFNDYLRRSYHLLMKNGIY
jgi:hypothetical protein